MTTTGPCILCQNDAEFVCYEAGEVVARFCRHHASRKRHGWNMLPIL